MYAGHTRRMKVVLADDGRPVAVDAVIDTYLNGLGRAGLRALVLDLAATSAEARRVLRLRASPAGSDVQRELIGQIDRALSQIDLNFHDPYEYDYYGGLSDEERFGELFDVLDEIERHLDAGRAEQMLPILERALTGLRQVGEDAEEADGLIDGAVGRVVTLYARACRAGHPEPVVLARWLVAFRADQPHWLDMSLEEFAGAFDEPAWLAYREAVSALDAAWTPDAGFDEVTAMGLELADRDGDIDRAIELLQRDDRTPFTPIIERLRAADRTDDALAWLDGGVREGRVGAGPYGSKYGIAASTVADMYLDANRADDAIAVLTELFQRRFHTASYRLLLETAALAGREDAVRTSALALARASADTHGGAQLVLMLLSDNDLVGAWEAADSFGVGTAWRELSRASEDEFPRRSADLYRPALADALRVANTKRYPGIADMLATMRRLYRDAGLSAEIDAEIRAIRATYRRRPALMAAMDAIHLPG